MKLTNELRKYINSLQRLKYRQKYNKYIAEGPKICLEFIRHGGHRIEYIACTEEFLKQEEETLSNLGKTIICNDNELKSISSLKTPNNVLIVVEPEPYVNMHAELQSGWSLYLDRIQDPGNMGTIMRIADWFGISWVLASEDSCDFYNPKVVQAAMGAHVRIRFDVLPTEELLQKYSASICSLALGGKPISEMQFDKTGILVVGNESRGVRHSILQASRHLLTIPKKGGAESLNASVACGISCYFLTNSIR